MRLYNVYPSVLVSKGYTRSTLIDIARGVIHYFPNHLLNKLEKNAFKGLHQEMFQPDEFDFLIEKELIFEVNAHNIDCFPRIELDWFFPSKLTNAVIELSEINALSLARITNFIGIAHFNFILRSNCTMLAIDKMIEFLEIYECDSCEITFLEGISPNLIEHLEKAIVNVEKCIVVNNWFNYEFGYKDKGDIDFEGSRMLDFDDNEMPISITKNMSHLTEAQEHHTFFNRKLYIGSLGEIKNALESPLSFGLLHELKTVAELDQIIELPAFKAYWYVKKTETSICSDCEFKFLCTDNRLPIQRTSGIWYHKTECKYNPYIAKWEGQDNYRSLLEVGVESTENGCKIDHEKISKINEEVWKD